MSISSLAASAQSSSGYAVDAWMDVELVVDIPDWEKSLFRTGRRHEFRHESH